jgi:hypothetical protein
MVKPGSVKDIGGIKVGTQFDGQMRMML